MGSLVTLIEGMIDIIDKNLVSKSNLMSNALTGEILIKVEDSFHFSDGQEIILIDYGYNDVASPHYQKYEYGKINKVINTHYITLTTPIVDPSGGWYVSNGGFIQKTIGSVPLYSDRILYGDREVIPTEDMAITVEPLSLSNEWLYIHGGLSEEYRVSIMVYGKNLETEEGMKILNLYTDAIYEIFNQNIHIDIDNYGTPILANVAAGTTLVVIEDTPDNRENFLPSDSITDDLVYELQDNIGVEIDLYATSVTTPGDGKIYINLSRTDPAPWGITPLNRAYNMQEYATLRRHGTYFYDSRIDNIDYGMVQKGSAYVRAAKLNWFGKKIKEYKFPQQSLRVPYFKEVEP